MNKYNSGCNRRHSINDILNVIQEIISLIHCFRVS